MSTHRPAERPAPAPLPVHNRPGLSAIGYRIGAHGNFNAAMHARLASADFPALTGLRTRDPRDFSIALLDAWAVTADVLSFYQERLANESYLHTATERASIAELAGLVGYRPRPGVAAEARLVFTVDPVPGVDGNVPVAAGTRVQSVPGPGESPQTFETTADGAVRSAWNTLRPVQDEPHQPRVGDREAWVQGADLHVLVGDVLLFLGLDDKGDDEAPGWDVRVVASVEADLVAARTRITWNGALIARELPQGIAKAKAGLFVMRRRAAVFGHNAPHWSSLPNEFRNNYAPASQGGAPSFQNATEWPGFRVSPKPRIVDLDAAYPAIRDGDPVVFLSPDGPHLAIVHDVIEASRAAFALSGKVTRLRLAQALPEALDDQLRDLSVHAEGQRLKPARRPLITPVAGGTIELASAVAGLARGQWLAVRGRIATRDEPIVEFVRIERIEAVAGRTRIVLMPPGLANAYERASVSISANVIAASHGETVSHVIGSGRGTQVNQAFRLGRTPVTHLADECAGGARSTVAVRVNDMAWQEVPTLSGAAPGARVHTLDIADDGTTTIRFGDGHHGARLPGGSDNVRAVWRTGLGVAGNVRAGALSTLLTRPQGVREVTNPLAAAGGDDPERADALRRNVARSLMTLGRVVSLADYEDLARGFAGVAKAHAVRMMVHGMPRIALTLAGPGGATIASDSSTARALSGALAAAGDPGIAVDLLPCRMAPFECGVRVRTDGVRARDVVLAELRDRLLATFSVEAMEFGQGVVLSRVVAVMHQVAGVVAVDVDRLERVSASSNSASGAGSSLPDLATGIVAQIAHVTAGGEVRASELVYLAGPDAITLEAMP